MPVRLSSLSVYTSEQDPANPKEDPFITMTFPVANDTFLRSVVQANKRMYNNAALGIILLGSIVLLVMVIICWWRRNRDENGSQMRVLEAQARKRQKHLSQDIPPLYDDLLEQGRMDKHLHQQEPPDYGAFLAQQQLSPYQETIWSPPPTVSGLLSDEGASDNEINNRLLASGQSPLNRTNHSRSQSTDV